MRLPANAACLTMMSSLGRGKVNPGVFEDFDIVPGRGRKAGLDLAGYREGFF